MKINKTLILIAILVLAGILRLWNLGGIPPHLTPDEASLGYNAYSILKTAKDEYGTFLPIIFKSFGDFKPGLYVYLTVSFVAALGLNEWAVRLPSALAGIISVGLVYLIVRLLFTNRRSLPLISAFVMAITPWNIYFSRGAWEVNVSLTLTLAGIYFFLKFLRNSSFIIHSSLFFASTLLAYQGAKLSTGIVLAILAILYWKEIFRFDRKILTASILVGLLVSTPIILSLFQGKAGRLEVFSVFSYPRPKEYLEKFLTLGNEKKGDLNYYLFHSETLNFIRGVMGRWFNHYSTRFLFFEGDWQNPRHTAPHQGVLLLSDFVLLIAGFVALIKYGVKKESLLIWLWLVLSTMPSALSRDQVHAVRALNMTVPLVVILALGLNSILDWIKDRKYRICYYFLLSTFSVVGFVYFLDAYFVHVPKHDSIYWEYGYKQIVETVTNIQSKYKEVKVQQSFAQPYIYFLFYQKYDPAKYQRQAKLIASEYKSDVGHVEKLDNICFCAIDWSVNRGESGTLFVADTVRIPPEDSSDEKLFKLIKEIKYLNGRDTAFRIIEVI